MTSRFESKVVLVTGGNSGIGQAIALAFAKEGAKVVIAARRASEGSETVAMIEELGGQAHFVQTDVSQAAEVEAMVAECVEQYGGLDYAVNNAGIEGTPLVQRRLVVHEVRNPRNAQARAGRHREHVIRSRAGRRTNRSRLLREQARRRRSDQGFRARVCQERLENQRGVSRRDRNSDDNPSALEQ